jgi:hypothetical protein
MDYQYQSSKHKLPYIIKINGKFPETNKTLKIPRNYATITTPQKSLKQSGKTSDSRFFVKKTRFFTKIQKSKNGKFAIRKQKQRHMTCTSVDPEKDIET